MAIQNNIKISRPYFENLDALRFLAAFSVFAFHFFSEVATKFQINTDGLGFKGLKLILSKGTLGVNLFFVLSGFLITYLILWERQQTGNFNLKHFLVRRTLRIWPLYFLIVIIGFLLFPIIIEGYHTNHSGWYYAFFLANFDEIRVGLNDSINFLTAPWSVAVEEQFYLFWGILLYLLHKLKAFNIWIVLSILLIISIVFSYQNYASDRILYYHTFSVMSNIVVGSALATAFFRKKKWLLKLDNLKKWQIIIIYIIGLLMILAKNKIFQGSLAIAEQSSISIFFAFVIFDQIHLTNSFFKTGNIKLFNHLGKISYGLYLYHLVVIYLLLHFTSTFFLSLSPILGISLFLMSSISATYLISIISYTYFEKPFLSLKAKFH